MKKYIFTLIAALLALLSFSFGQNVAAQEDTGSYGIHIIKYNLNDSQESQLTHDGTPVTSGTEDLQRLAGIQYTITRMTKTEMNTYVTAEGADAFSQTVTTNAQGEAELTGLLVVCTKSLNQKVSKCPHQCLLFWFPSLCKMQMV